MSAAQEGAPRLRLDKWLWAARFFKTRSLASAAVEGGHVHLNGTRTKPAHAIKAGDMLDITLGRRRLTVEVRALADRRGPAPVAQTLYEETEESRLRAAQAAAPAPGTHRGGGRPTKQDRRRIDRLRED